VEDDDIVPGRPDAVAQVNGRRGRAVHTGGW